MFAITSLTALAFAYSALAIPGPLTPVPAEAGATCLISWTPDPTGTWTQTNIELMSGDNQNMVHLTTVATNVDTTASAPASMSWTCPDVTLYAAVYFYQFSHAAEPDNLTWTTRWAIESATGEIVGAPNATQPDGTAIAWGTGLLKDPSTAKPAPSYITGQTSGGSGTGAPADAGSAIVVTAGSASVSATGTASLSTAAGIATIPVKATTSTPSIAAAAPTSTTTSSTTKSSSGAGLVRSSASIMTAGAGAVLAGLLALV